MIKKKIRSSNKKDNSSLTTNDSYDHYIALDFSEKNMAIARMSKSSRHPKVIDVPSDLKDLKVYLSTLNGRKILTIEETNTAQWLYVELYEIVDKILICDPYRNRLLSEGAKTDKIDAGNLCILLKNGLLKEVYHSTDEIYEIRKLVSYYEDEVKAGVRLLNQRSALYRSENKSSKQGDSIKNSRINNFISEQLDEKISSYQEKKKKYEAEFSQISKKNKTVKSLESIPGLGPISSVTIFSKVIDPRRFKSSGDYLSYCGLVKHEKLSGGRSYGKRKTRYCRKLKGIYKSAALRATTNATPIKEYYDYLVNDKKLTEYNARNAIARYIARISLGIIKNPQKYMPYKWRKGKQEKQTA